MFLTNLLVGTLGLFWALVCIVYIVFQTAFSYIAYGYYFGLWAAIFIVGFCFVLRITLPLAIGLFLGLRIVYGLEWYIALLISFPSILFLFPSSIALIVATIKGAFNSHEERTFNNQTYENLYEENELIERVPLRKKVSKPRRFKKGDLVISEYEFEDENGKKYNGVGKVLGINKHKEKKGNRSVIVEYYEIKFGRKKLYFKVSQQKKWKLKKYKN